jgi:N-sulfoglucosamine sulfohydrolase
MMKNLSLALIISSSGGFLMNACQSEKKAEPRRPNILIAISDDQSFPHTSFAGCRFVNTPGFDRIATEGVYFTNCIAGSPGCAPSRSSLVTGRYHWQNEQSGQHASSWLNKYVPYIDLLEAAGYHSGFTGKGVGPFQYKRSEADSLWRKDNAAGKPFNRFQYTKGESSDERTAEGIAGNNYFANFVDFMRQRQTGQPFYFWYGSSEPHRDYEKDSWKRNGKSLDMVDVPGFYPDSEEIRGDMLDYAVEIEWFDLHLTRMLNYLDSLGELENTIVIVTSDNGMPFPRAKANCFDFGIHVPLAVRYPKVFAGNRIVNDPVSFVDIAPTLLELTGTLPDGMMPMSGRSFVNILKSKKSGIVDETRKYVFAGRERHSSSRWNNLGYPQRAIRSVNHLLIWNIKPERWPAGAPQRLMPGSDTEHFPMFGIDEKGIHHSEWAFADVDAAPAKSFLIENHNNEAISRYFDLSFGKRPEFELYDIVSDPYCLDNLYGVRDYLQIAQEMISVLMNELEKSADPRVVGPDAEIFDTYIRYSPMREFPVPDWASVD